MNASILADISFFQGGRIVWYSGTVQQKTKIETSGSRPGHKTASIQQPGTGAHWA